MLADRNRLSVCSDSLFKELAFNSCKPYNASSSLYYCQYFYFKERLITSGENSQGGSLKLLLLKIYKGKSKFSCIWLSWVIFAVLLFPIKISASDSERVVISPISVLGEIPVPEQQMLFNRFREQINQHYSLVSYQVLEMIAEQEESIDIENCKSGNCAQKVKNFINRIRWQFKTDDLFLFGLVKSETETQLSLKLSSLSAPEVTQIIVTRTCHDCGIGALMDEVDKLVQRMLQKIVE
ncbi:uncharacterized protein METZ01_LOCUS218686, partial [marine metagenome]